MWKDELISMLWEYGIIGVNFQEPITFKSGIKSPIYCDFRKLQAYPDVRNLVISELQRMLPADIDGILGVATGAVPYASILGDKLNLPTGYIRPDAKAKDHGLKKLIEGMDVAGKKIVIIEDLVSTAGSIINNADIARLHDAKRIELISIFSYDMERSKKELLESGFALKSLITIHDVMPLMFEKLSTHDYDSLEVWVHKPEEWFDCLKRDFNQGFLTSLRLSDWSAICFGIDPVPMVMPSQYSKHGIMGAANYFVDLITEMRKRDILPGMFKLNEGFYGRHHEDGRAAMVRLMDGLTSIDEIRDLGRFPNPPVIIDAKRGDIGKSSDNYAHEFLGDPCIDWSGITVNPYMGEDSVKPFINFCNKEQGKGVYILNKTSNPGANDFQMLKMADGRFFYQHVTDKIIEWAKGRPGVGAVVGGNSIEELAVSMRAYAGKGIPLLIPGVGAQGGSAREVANIARQTGFELSLLRINSSSGLATPWYKKEGDSIPGVQECIEMSIHELQKLNEEVGPLEPAAVS